MKRYVAAVFAPGCPPFWSWYEDLAEARAFTVRANETKPVTEVVLLLETTPPRGVDEGAFGEWVDSCLEFLPDHPQDGIEILELHLGGEATEFVWARIQEEAV